MTKTEYSREGSDKRAAAITAERRAPLLPNNVTIIWHRATAHERYCTRRLLFLTHAHRWRHRATLQSSWTPFRQRLDSGRAGTRRHISAGPVQHATITERSTGQVGWAERRDPPMIDVPISIELRNSPPFLEILEAFLVISCSCYSDPFDSLTLFLFFLSQELVTL